MEKHEPKEVTFYLNGEEIAKAHTIPDKTIIGIPVNTETVEREEK